jgi:DNA mismatch repair ATPase MutS
LGDFYETFSEDAKIASRELEIFLTTREMSKGHRVPMAGVPSLIKNHPLLPKERGIKEVKLN